ncbi:hypothetical protein V6N13_139809 [Hibiscus sabdariffa]|uniref:Uncharacterized protein n=2 Tax=Hibiscus sabdariffa TaxID=183260 RepID=A0ABR2B2Y2_9ROSI
MSGSFAPDFSESYFLYQNDECRVLTAVPPSLGPGNRPPDLVVSVESMMEDFGSLAEDRRQVSPLNETSVQGGDSAVSSVDSLNDGVKLG